MLNYKPTTISAPEEKKEVILDDKDYMLFEMLKQIFTSLEKLRRSKSVGHFAFLV